LTGQLSRSWHRDSRPPIATSTREEGEDWKNTTPPAGIQGNQRRILLVDDEPTIREVTKLLLERRGFEVVTAKDGVTGLLAYSANPNFIAVISDLRMPRADGRTLITSLRALSPTLPIICMTGNLASAQDTDEFKQQTGINTVLHKPFSDETLMASLERELAQVS
jgi:CheY-like chemotaxis protein